MRKFEFGFLRAYRTLQVFTIHNIDFTKGSFFAPISFSSFYCTELRKKTKPLSSFLRQNKKSYDIGNTEN